MCDLSKKLWAYQVQTQINIIDQGKFSFFIDERCNSSQLTNVVFGLLLVDGSRFQVPVPGSGSRFQVQPLDGNKNFPRLSLGRVSHFFKNSGKSPIGLMMLLFNLASCKALPLSRPCRCISNIVPVVPAL